MTDIYGEPVRIVRKRREGEAIPSYSTAALLCGCTWPVRIEKKVKAFGPEFQMMGLGLGAKIMRERRDEKFAPHRETIIRMLREKIPMAAIGRVIGIPADGVALYVKVHELKKVANDAA